MFEQLLNELAHRPVVQGISMVDVLDLPEPLGAALRRMIRAGALPLHDFATALKQPRSLADGLCREVR